MAALVIGVVGRPAEQMRARLVEPEAVQLGKGLNRIRDFCVIQLERLALREFPDSRVCELSADVQPANLQSLLLLRHVVTPRAAKSDR